MLLKIFILNIFLHVSTGVIYHLNDSEYERMPPVYELDRYESCLREENGTYCYTKLGLFAEPSNELNTLIKEYSAHRYKHYNHSLIERGICVRRKCKKHITNYDLEKEENLKAILEECVDQIMLDDYGLHAELLEYYCDKHNETPDINIYDWIVLYLIYALVFINVAGTLCDIIVQRLNYEKNDNYGWKHLMSFSIIQNWNSLVSSEPEEPRLKKLQGIHALKCILMFLFIIGHVIYVFHGNIDNTHQFEQYYDYSLYKLVFNALPLVQMLFTMSGFLLMYHLLIESEKRDVTWKLVPKMILLRFWRLTPANAVYVLFSATFLRHWNTGPVWKMTVTSRMSGDCRKYWWAHLLFINNYIPEDAYCAIQNWHLAADFHLFILGLCIFVAFKGQRRMLVLSSLVLVGMASKAFHIWWGDLDPFLIMTPEIYRWITSPSTVVHKFSHNNLPGFMIGMITGHFVHKWQKEKVDFSTSRFKLILVALSHSIIPSLVSVIYTGSYFYADGDQPSLAIRIAYGMVLMLVFALITSYSICLMVFGFSDFWSKFLNWTGWTIPSRLTYCVSLIHLFFITIIYGSRTQLIHMSSLNHTITHLGVAAMSFLCAIPYCLMIEAPFNKLAKNIASRNAQQVKKID